MTQQSDGVLPWVCFEDAICVGHSKIQKFTAIFGCRMNLTRAQDLSEWVYGRARCRCRSGTISARAKKRKVK